MSPNDLLIAIWAAIAFLAVPFLAIAAIFGLGLAAERVWHLCGDVFHGMASRLHHV